MHAQMHPEMYAPLRCMLHSAPWAPRGCVSVTRLCVSVPVAVWERVQGAIKVADIGHLYAELSVHIKWSERLEEEMWRQGDVEKARNMKVLSLAFAFSSPVCACVCQHKANRVSFPKPDAAGSRCYPMRR